MTSTSIHINTNAAPRPIPRSSGRNTAKAISLYQRLNEGLTNFGRVKASERAAFFRLLATMIDAGISIVRSLEILTEQIENPLLKRVIRGMIRDIESGSSLSASLSHYPKHFTLAEIGMVEAGEASGRMKEVLMEIAKQTEKSAAFLRKIKAAMIYPAVVILIMLASGFAVMTFVMPKIKEMFEGLGGELPPLTQGLIGFSDFLVTVRWGLPNAFWLASLIAFLISGLLIWKRRTRTGAYLWTRLVFALPIFGKLSKQAAIARFCRSLSTLVSSGIPILKALYITSNSIGNSIYEARVQKIADDVKHGITMAENMKSDKAYFPSMLVGMIGVAEQTAQLDSISGRLADYYESEVDDMVRGLSSLIEPFIIVVLGLAVAVLVLAVMQPILTLTDLTV